MQKRSLKSVFGILGLSFLMGATPIALNLTVDPYQLFWKRERATAINEIAEKAHYPLWKLARYRKGTHGTIILGDSRARSLRDKYWHEAGMHRAINLAYGGGTIPEIYSTFQLLKEDRAIRRLVIGMQLRSLDEDHKKGMNRVPEAVEVLSNRINYLKNWHVTNTATKVFAAENPKTIEFVNELSKQFATEVQAAELGALGNTKLDTLLEPMVCFGCELPSGLAPLPFFFEGGPDRTRLDYLNSSVFRHYSSTNTDNSRLPEYYLNDIKKLAIDAYQDLPKKHSRQVLKNGTADWRDFNVSNLYWNYLEEISIWANERDVEVIFVVPPTVAPMQRTILDHGVARQNHEMRLRLSHLGTVIDFDYPNALTKDPTNFSDAYHFNSKVARAIVGEIVRKIDDVPSPKRRKYSFGLACPNGVGETLGEGDKFGEVQIQNGIACRVWSSKR